MSPLLTFLLTIINLQNDLIQKMYILLVGKVLLKPSFPEQVRQDYRKMQVDDLPVLIKQEKLDYHLLLQAHFNTHGRVSLSNGIRIARFQFLLRKHAPDAMPLIYTCMTTTRMLDNLNAKCEI